MESVTTVYPEAYYRVSLKAVIRNEKNEVLVVKEGDATSWGLPGGGIDHGETVEEALARELHEEVGYQGTFAAAQLRHAETFYVRPYQAWGLWLVYEVIPESFDFSVGEHATEIAFIDPAILKDSDNRSEQLVYKFCVDASASYDRLHLTKLI